MTSDLHLDSSEVALLTDLYELTMAASYLEHGFNDPACFSLSVRRLPPRRGYLVAAGTERFFEAVAALRFDAKALEYLDSLKLFKPEFLDYLSRFRFTGSIRALPEGTICFAEEPILEVDAPLIEAQMLETLAINQVSVATMIASKAARCYGAAAGRRLIEFGLRRSPGGRRRAGCRPRQLPGGFQRHGQCAGRQALRNSGLWHDGAQLCDGARARARSVCRLRQ